MYWLKNVNIWQHSNMTAEEVPWEKIISYMLMILCIGIVNAILFGGLAPICEVLYWLVFCIILYAEDDISALLSHVVKYPIWVPFSILRPNSWWFMPPLCVFALSCFVTFSGDKGLLNLLVAFLIWTCSFLPDPQTVSKRPMKSKGKSKTYCL